MYNKWGFCRPCNVSDFPPPHLPRTHKTYFLFCSQLLASPLASSHGNRSKFVPNPAFFLRAQPNFKSSLHTSSCSLSAAGLSVSAPQPLPSSILLNLFLLDLSCFVFPPCAGHAHSARAGRPVLLVSTFASLVVTNSTLTQLLSSTESDNSDDSDYDEQDSENVSLFESIRVYSSQEGATFHFQGFLLAQTKPCSPTKKSYSYIPALFVFIPSTIIVLLAQAGQDRTKAALALTNGQINWWRR